MAEWVQLSGGGAPGIAGPPGSGSSTPAAPNVTATATIFYQPLGNGQEFGAQGRITLPVGDPNYAHLKWINIYGRNAAGQMSQPFITLTGWSGSWIDYNVTGVKMAIGPEPPADETWDIVFVVANEDAVPTVPAFAVTGLVVHHATITSLVPAEISGARYQDAREGLHTVVSATISLDHYPQNVTFWIDYDKGTGPTWNGEARISGPGTVVRFGDSPSGDNLKDPGTIWVPAPGNTAWEMAALLGFPGDAGQLTRSQIAALGATFASFTVTAVGACLATDVTGAAFNLNPLTSHAMDYALADPGIYLWDFYQLQFTQPTLLTDENYWFTFLTVQKGHTVSGTGTVSGGVTFTKTSGATPFTASMPGNEIHVNGVLNQIQAYVSPTVVTLTYAAANGAGQSYEVWVPAADREGVDEAPYGIYRGRWVTDSGQFQGTVSVPGTTVYLNGAQPANWTMPPVHNPDGSPNLETSFRFRLYCASHANDNEASSFFPYTLQTVCWPANADGSQDHTDLTPTPQPSALDLTTVTPWSVTGPLSGGAGAPITVSAGGISTTFLADLAASSVKIADAAVLTAKLADVSVSTVKLAALAVDNTKLAALAVQAGNLAASSVTATAIASLAVGTGAIAVLAVGNAQIGNLSVSVGKIQVLSITTGMIVDLSVTTAKIANLAVTDAQIGNLSVSKLLAGTISVSVSLTSPTLVVTGAGFVINLDSTNGFKVTSGSVVTQIIGSQISIYSSGTAVVTLGDFGGPNGYAAFRGPAGTIACLIGASGNDGVLVCNGGQVITKQQAGPGNPSFGSLGAAQTWCQNLLTALRTHGMVS